MPLSFGVEYLDTSEANISKKNNITEGDDPYKLLSFYKKFIGDDKEQPKHSRDMWKYFDTISQDILKLPKQESKTSDTYNAYVYCIVSDEDRKQGIANIILQFSIDKEDANDKFHTPKILLHKEYTSGTVSTISIQPQINSGIDRRKNRYFSLNGFLISGSSETAEGVTTPDENIIDTENFLLIKSNFSEISERIATLQKDQQKKQRQKNREKRKDKRENKKNTFVQKSTDILYDTKGKIVDKKNIFLNETHTIINSAKSEAKKLKNEIKQSNASDIPQENIDNELQDQLDRLDE